MCIQRLTSSIFTVLIARPPRCPKAMALMLFFAVALLPSAVSAEMSVNGFFPADYVRTDVFAAKNAEGSSDVSFRTVSAPTIQKQAASPKPKVQRVRPRSGRFVKDARGTVRSSVQQSEWDVSPIIPNK